MTAAIQDILRRWQGRLSQSPVVCVGDGGANQLGVVRCFGRRGIAVLAIRANGARPLNSRYAQEIRLPGYGALPAALGEIAAANLPHPPVVFACSDAAVREMASPPIRTLPGLLFTFPTWDVLRLAADKAALAEGCPEFALPATVVCRPGEALGRGIESLPLPAMVKPASCRGQEFVKVFGAKNMMAGDRDALATILNKASARGLDVIAQEFIAGWQLGGIICLYRPDGTRAADSQFVTVRKCPPQTGYTTSQLCGPNVFSHVDVSLLDAFARRTGCWGVLEAEFKCDARDDRWKLMEINTRPVLQNRGFAAAGVDFEAMLYDEVRRQDAPASATCAAAPPAVASANATAPAGPIRWGDARNDLASVVMQGQGVAQWLANFHGGTVWSTYAGDDRRPALSRIMNWPGTLAALARNGAVAFAAGGLLKNAAIAMSRLSQAPRILRRRHADCPVIVSYHGVAPDAMWRDWETSDLVSEGLFRRHLEFYRRRYRVVTLRQIAACLSGGEPLPQRALAITFDDGFRNNIDCAWPLLREFGFAATVFVTTGFIDGTARPWWVRAKQCILARRPTDASAQPRAGDDYLEYRRLLASLAPMPAERRESALAEMEAGLAPARVPDLLAGIYAPMTWDQARRAAAQGLEFGAHTVTHPRLSAESPDRMAFEIAESVARIRRELGPKDVAFAYPSGQVGDFDATAEQCARQAGCYAAVANWPGFNRGVDQLFRLCRFPVGGRHSAAAIEVELCGLRAMLGSARPRRARNANTNTTGSAGHMPERA